MVHCFDETFVSLFFSDHTQISGASERSRERREKKDDTKLVRKCEGLGQEAQRVPGMLSSLLSPD